MRILKSGGHHSMFKFHGHVTFKQKMEIIIVSNYDTKLFQFSIYC
jgi:hypothetical protein